MSTVKEILETLKAFFAKLAHRSQAQEAQTIAQAGEEMVSKLQQIYDAGLRAMREGNMARNAQQNTAGPNNLNMKQQRRDDTKNTIQIGMSEEEQNDAQLEAEEVFFAAEDSTVDQKLKYRESETNRDVLKLIKKTLYIVVSAFIGKKNTKKEPHSSSMLKAPM